MLYGARQKVKQLSPRGVFYEAFLPTLIGIENDTQQ